MAKLGREQTESPKADDKVIPPYKGPKKAKRERIVIRPLATPTQMEPVVPDQEKPAATKLPADRREVSITDLYRAKRRLGDIRRSLDFILKACNSKNVIDVQVDGKSPLELAHQLKKTLVAIGKEVAAQ